MKINPNLAATFDPPVMEARRWLSDTPLPPDLPLLNVSQAAPVDPPPAPLRAEMARLVTDLPDAHLYGPVLGLPELRDEIARRWSAAYGGQITAAHVALTAGCNQAFTAAIATLCAPGDAVILPTPYYFNHRMALDMAGVAQIDLPVGADMLPDPERAASLITPTTRAIALVSPNNPAGLAYPSELIQSFATLARRHGIALILDETYRDFHPDPGAPHPLFADPDWDDTLIHLYSFSKSFRLCGHRVGALIAAPATLAQVEKYLDTVTICPAQLGQYAALWGLQNLTDWLAGERTEILTRGAATAALTIGGFTVQSAGAYFAWLTHGFDLPSDQLAQEMLRQQAILALPGTMFTPGGGGTKGLRIAFANVDTDGIAELARRLGRMRL